LRSECRRTGHSSSLLLLEWMIGPAGLADIERTRQMTMHRPNTDSPRGALKTAAAESSRYQHARYHASPDLDPFVEHFWSVAWDLRGLSPERVGVVGFDHRITSKAFDVHVFLRVSRIRGHGRFTRRRPSAKVPAAAVSIVAVSSQRAVGGDFPPVPPCPL